MNEVTIWFDESGFTGEDLMNPEQRYFALASSIVGDDEAEALLRQCFPRYGGTEFKFSALWRRPSHREGFLDLAERLPALSGRTFVYIVDKRYSILVKIVDYLIEPIVTASGHDFYRQAYGRKFVNALNMDLREHGTPEVTEELLTLWHGFARDPSEASLARLEAFLAAKARSSGPPLSSFFALAGQGTAYFRRIWDRLEDFTQSNELQVSSMLMSVSHWRLRRDEDLRIVHDESSSFFRQRDMWAALTRDDMPPFEAETATGQSIPFPLRITETRTERSEASPAIQLCDILAGLFSRATRLFAGERDQFLLQLFRGGLGDASFDGVMPLRERPAGPPPRREGPDMLDTMVEVLRPALQRREEKR